MILNIQFFYIPIGDVEEEQQEDVEEREEEENEINNNEQDEEIELENEEDSYTDEEQEDDFNYEHYNLYDSFTYSEYNNCAIFIYKKEFKDFAKLVSKQLDCNKDLGAKGPNQRYDLATLAEAMSMQPFSNHIWFSCEDFYMRMDDNGRIRIGYNK